jgi:hypothetical protein
MKLKNALGILLITALGVGLLSVGAGYCFGCSGMAHIDADLFDDLADAFAPIYSAENIQSMRNSARDLKNLAIEMHDYGMYCIVGVILVGVGGAGWMVWGFRKDEGRMLKGNPSDKFTEGEVNQRPAQVAC